MLAVGRAFTWVEYVGAPVGHGPPAPRLVIVWRIERQPSSLPVGWSAQVAVVWALNQLSIQLFGAEKLRPVHEQQIQRDLPLAGKQAQVTARAVLASLGLQNGSVFHRSPARGAFCSSVWLDGVADLQEGEC